VAVYTGGAHCCTWIEAYRISSNAASSSPIKEDIGNPHANVVERNGQAVIVTADNAFAYEFACYGCSGLPISVLELHQGRFVSITSKYPDWITEDSAYWFMAGDSSAPGAGLGYFAAWVADECTLDQGSQAFDTLNQLQADGYLVSTSNPEQHSGWPSGSAYISQLRNFLSVHGYCS
jgi:hypothetical protein